MPNDPLMIIQSTPERAVNRVGPITINIFRELLEPWICTLLSNHTQVDYLMPFHPRSQ